MTSEGVERASLAVGQCAWDVIDDAQSAKRMTVARNERRTGIEADVRLAVHDRVFAEAHILESIVDDENPATPDGVRTERHAARRLGNRHPKTRLEPLPILVHERDERNRRAANLRREQDDVVEGLLRLRVEDPVAAQRRQTSGLARVHHPIVALHGLAHTAPATEVR